MLSNLLNETSEKEPLTFWKEYCEENNLSYSIAVGRVKSEKENDDKEENKD